ncbi:exodeoxyribonuclease VII large subunit [Helicobacter kayseriensis]|uniref:exodeoxyribonuclease VII large subunit n=1 Tax=Helicobacter kayseriensis TaxID=2905877 RepID=UPI001E56AD08|nr:exodeoxyribonuclease VII large subunit [Helicobacter kayseriensis]MCE3046704.1 exodeoxyribonuclease VII large subunit [Helicobacter kayseriensis]MCE3047994.1 exodeoxyribonuclease VII large subunit [Helicobacter kayseriensis]
MQKPLSVFELNAQIKSILEETFLSVFVEGEISNLTIHSSGHIYFSLKDSQSSIACVLFRGNAQHLKLELKEGLHVEVIGGLSVYPPRGNYQILCKQILSSKIGNLALAYENLKQKLHSQGYFQNKKPLPPFPKKVALITSATGAALQDMLKIANKRWRLTEFIIINTLVQGEGAKLSIAQNIALADSLEGIDCIVLARGGGSQEDLWAFNEEMVADAIYHAKTPIISAIGHESDVLISDFVADCRAPTPSGAMELLLPDQVQWLYALEELREKFSQAFRKILGHKSLLLSSLQDQYKFANHSYKIQLQEKECHQIKQMLQLKIQTILKNKTQESHMLISQFHSFQLFQHFEKTLDSLQHSLALHNPSQKCKNGYAQITKNGKVFNLEEIQEEEIFELTSPKITIKAQRLPKD